MRGGIGNPESDHWFKKNGLIKYKHSTSKKIYQSTNFDLRVRFAPFCLCLFTNSQEGMNIKMTLDYKNTLYAIILAFFSIDLVHDWE